MPNGVWYMSCSPVSPTTSVRHSSGPANQVRILVTPPSSELTAPSWGREGTAKAPALETRP